MKLRNRESGVEEIILEFVDGNSYIVYEKSLKKPFFGGGVIFMLSPIACIHQEKVDELSLQGREREFAVIKMKEGETLIHKENLVEIVETPREAFMVSQRMAFDYAYERAEELSKKYHKKIDVSPVFAEF